jgi:hypothetical protein
VQAYDLIKGEGGLFDSWESGQTAVCPTPPRPRSGLMRPTLAAPECERENLPSYGPSIPGAFSSKRVPRRM